MHQRISLVNKTNNKLLYISKTDIGDDFKASYHSHSNLEILLITKGKGKILTTNKTIPIKEKDIVIINSNSNHCEISSSECEFLAIGVNHFNAFLDDSFKKKIIYFPVKDEEYEKIKKLYNIIFLESQIKDGENIISSCFENIITLITRNSNTFFNSTTSEVYTSLISNALNIIDNYFYSNLSINDLASRLSVSPSLLCHQFKKETGKTIIEYKLTCQIQEACNLLKITDMSILDISSAIGINNSAYFSKVFKKIMGCTPKEYRNFKL